MGVVVKKTEEQDFLSSLGVKPVSAVQPIQTESTDFLSEMGVKKGTKLERLAKSFGSGAFGTVTSAASALEAALPKVLATIKDPKEKATYQKYI